VDDEIERLERAHRQDPSPENATRLKAALLRAGRRDELRGRYKLGFACDQAWDRMRGTSRMGVKVCDACRREVHLATTYRDFDRLAAAGHCVAVLPHQLPKVLDGLIDAPGRGLSRGPGGTCLLEGSAPLPPMPLAGVPMPVRPPPPPPPEPPST
jgi:hypothetical protein